MNVTEDEIKNAPPTKMIPVEGAVWLGNHYGEDDDWRIFAVPIRATDQPNAAPDTERLDFLQRWVWDAKRRGFVWDTFTFETSKPVRAQLDAQMAAGMREPPKHGTTDNGPTPQPSAESCEADVLLTALGLDAERFRTECGFINVPKVLAALKHPDDYRGLYLRTADNGSSG